jgi:hypothetical protein
MIAATVLVVATKRHQAKKLHEARQRATASASIYKTQAENQLNVLEQDLKAKAREADARRRIELNQAWGGSVTAAFKNPAYSIREALQHAAEACAPTNAYAHVDVDRFTEFVVTIDRPDALSTNEMVVVARRLVPVAKEFLSALQFSTRGKLIAEIDRQDMDFIENWTHASDQRIAMLLPRETESRMDSGAIERFKAEQQISTALNAEPGLREKTERVDRNFRQAIQNAYGELTQAMEALQKSMALGAARSLRDLDLCDKELRHSVELANRAKSFWNDPLKEWQRLLEAEGVSGDLRDALVKSFSGIFHNDALKTKKVFDTLNAAVESSQFTLRLLENENDKWKFTSSGIALIDDEFGRKFDRAQHQVREDMRAMEEALRTWHEATGP